MQRNSSSSQKVLVKIIFVNVFTCVSYEVALPEIRTKLSDPFYLVLSNTYFVCGFVLLPWNFPLGCSKATLSAPCFLLQPSTPLANTLWAEGLALLGWRVERCCGGASSRSEARLPLVRNRFGGQGIPSVRGYPPMSWYPFAMQFLTVDPIALLFVSLVREGQQRLFIVRNVVNHWTLGSWPPPLVFWRIIPTTLYEIRRVNLITKKDFTENIFTVIRRYLLVSAIVVNNQGRM